MENVFICHPKRSAIGRYGGSLASIRPDDLLAQVIKGVISEASELTVEQIDEVYMGCANQSGEDNRNIARMSLLLAGLPVSIPGATVNRLCASGMEAVSMAFRAINSGEISLALAGGVESMTRAPYVMGKASKGSDRTQKLEDTTMGWRFVNPELKAMYGTETMPETAENLAEKYGISQQDQDKFAFNSQQKALQAQLDGRFSDEIVSINIPQRRGAPATFECDEHLRADTTLASLAQLKSPFRAGGSVTAGNASGINDGAAAMLIAGEQSMVKNGLVPCARICGFATAGVAPTVMGEGPVPAIQKLLSRLGLAIENMDIIELNEAFAAQVLACTRQLGLSDDDPRINPQGGAIALGHPLGMSGARLMMTAAQQLQRENKRYALCAMCIGVGQGMACVIEKV